MKDVILVSENFVRSNTNISSNLQDKFIQSAVREATDVDFEEEPAGKMAARIQSDVDGMIGLYRLSINVLLKDLEKYNSDYLIKIRIRLGSILNSSQMVKR